MVKKTNHRKFSILYSRLAVIILASCWICVGCRSTRIYERVLLYQSVDQNGDSLLLSGKVSVPIDHAPKGIILLPHFTIASNNEVPSTSTIEESKAFRSDYVLIMPDYIGYGASRERTHPYLHGELTAKNCVDMLLASESLLDSLQVPVSGDSIYLVGFSQGGATVLWTLRLLEQEYSDRYHVIRCFAGSGPYDVASTYNYCISRNKVGMGMVIPMLVMGTSAAYNLNLSRELFFTPAMNSHYDRWIASKEYSYLTLYFLMANKKVSHWLTPYGADRTQPQTRQMYNAYLRSSLVHLPIGDEGSVEMANDDLPASECDSVWLPKSPVYIFHSTTDDIVPYCNANHLRRSWGEQSNIQYDYDDYGSHLRSIRTFLPKVKKMLDIASE